MWLVLLTFIVGILASMVSGIVGAGAGLLTAPFFILIGLPPQVAVATTKFGAVGLSAGSVTRFWKSKAIIWPYALLLLPISVISAFAGSRLLLEIDETIVKKVVGFVILGLIPLIFFKKNIGVKKIIVMPLKKTLGFIAYFIILSLQAAFGAGLGTLLLFVLIFGFGFTFIEANATKRLPGFVMALIALIVYIINGVVAYTLGFAMLLGMIVGGYIGTHVAIKKGNVWVKTIFLIVLILLSIKLLT